MLSRIRPRLVSRALSPFSLRVTFDRSFCDKTNESPTHSESSSQSGAEKDHLTSPTAKLITRGAGVLMLGAVGWYVNDVIKKNLPQNEVADVKVKTEGEIDIGAPFTLIDHNGVPRDSTEDFGGKFMLIYFGFTFCPDICPTELDKMAEVINQLELEKKSDYVTPLLITVDPYRDTPEQLASYVKEFHPKLIGLTGTPEEIKKVAKDYRIYNVVPDNAGEEDYLVDHSVFTFLMGPQGGFLDFFGPDKTEKDIIEAINGRIQDYEEEKNPPPFTEICTRKANIWRDAFFSFFKNSK